jgi:hypothetical protein
MRKQINKLQAHASHLLDGFLGLREKYAMLEPMLFDHGVVGKYGTGKKARGFEVIKNALFFACAQEIAKLSLDNDDRCPSIKNVVDKLHSEPLLNELREQYAVWDIDPDIEETDPDNLPALTAALKAMTQREEAERRIKFDAHVAQLRTKWETLSDSPVLMAFKTIRHKISAHTDVHLINGEYKLVNIGELGIKWGDLKDTIEALQELVELISLIVKSSSFAWDSLDDQLSKTASGFWNVQSER